MAEAVEEIKPRVIEVKGKVKIPIGYPYYGLATREGFKPVLIRTERKRADKPDAIHDQLEWYERPVMDDAGKGTMLLYYLRVTPQLPLDYESPLYQFPLFSDCLYPVAVWNITKALFSEVDNKPFWKTMSPMGEDKRPIGVGGAQFRAFHFVVINNRFAPTEIRPGLTDDGNWTVGKPVAGQWIIDQLKTEELAGRDPLSYMQTVESPERNVLSA